LKGIINSNDSNATFLNEVICCYNRNAIRPKAAYRYSEPLRLFTAYIRMIGGKLSYQTLQANNVGGIPSLSSTYKYINKTRCHFTEGLIRTKELKKYLLEQNLPMVVSLSEDATGISGRIQYNARTNQIIGFTLPLDGNGIPVPNYYPAQCASEIEGYFYDIRNKEKQPANYLNVVMAQPMKRGIPAFCLMAYCTNGKYKAPEVGRRWAFLAKELKEHGIETISIGSDCDPRYNSVMKQFLHFGRQSPENVGLIPNWFGARFKTDLAYYPIQDILHIGTKFRNRLLNHTPKIGSHLISIKHLLTLIQKVTKEKHKLTQATIKPTDRQNFDSVLKICSDAVIELLASNVEYSEGTVMYLRIMSNILRAFLDLTLTPLQRVRMIWFSNFMLRIWRSHLIETGRDIKENFITSYCYSCVEFNAHSLILIILNLKENGLDHLFFPELLGSQPCESNFRQIRSFTPTFSTVTNFSMLEVLQKLSKIELQNQIVFIKLKHFNFPRIGKQSSSYYSKIDQNGRDCYSVSNPLPTLNEIIEQVELARIQAIEYTQCLKVSVNGDLICSIRNQGEIPDYADATLFQLHTDEQLVNVVSRLSIDDNAQNVDTLRVFPEIDLTEYSKKIDANTVTANGLYVKVRNVFNEVFYVTKHTIVWLLSKTTTKLSSDRLRRVMARRD
jgi:hypothetical protein